MSRVYFGLGSNRGDKAMQLTAAIEKINEQIGRVTSQSTFYVTQPWGYESTHSYLNAAAGCDTLLQPDEVLERTQQIERAMGRDRKSVNGNYEDRLIDIDLLLFDDRIIQTERLVVPHPLMHQRLFVLEPLNEIAPNEVHPVLHKTINELLHLIS